jgi:hypothetical protein
MGIPSILVEARWAVTRGQAFGDAPFFCGTKQLFTPRIAAHSRARGHRSFLGAFLLLAMPLTASHAIAFGTGAVLAWTLAWKLARRGRVSSRAKLQQQAPGILYDTIAREWRCKVATRDDLGVAQEAWQPFAQSVAQIPGCVRVQRLCCGHCLDFRIVVTMDAAAYGSWKDLDHYPEANVLGALRASPGCSDVRSQLLSIMDCS